MKPKAQRKTLTDLKDLALITLDQVSEPIAAPTVEDLEALILYASEQTKWRNETFGTIIRPEDRKHCNQL